MDEEPRDPITVLQEGAAQLHEAYVSWIDAGFAPHEALYLCGQILQAGLRRPPEGTVITPLGRQLSPRARARLVREETTP